MASGTFCTVVNCLDGRVQLPVIAFLKRHFDVEFVDTITEAGPVRALAGKRDAARVASIFRRVEISITAHHSCGIAVVAHHDCAGNPKPDDQQLDDLRKSAAVLRQRYPRVVVIALWVDADWKVRQR